MLPPDEAGIISLGFLLPSSGLPVASGESRDNRPKWTVDPSLAPVRP